MTANSNAGNSVERINAIIDLANDMHGQLKQHYIDIYEGGELQARTAVLFHAILESCSNALDQLMHLAWEIRLKPKLNKFPKNLGYFPISETEDSYRQALLRWGVNDLAILDFEFDNLLRRFQLFNSSNSPIRRLFRPWVNKKHVTLTNMTHLLGSESLYIAGSILTGEGILHPGDSRGIGIRVDRPDLGEGSYEETRIVIAVEESEIDAFWFAGRMIRMAGGIVDKFKDELDLP